MTTAAQASALRRLVLGWLSCFADVVARELPADGLAAIEVVLPGGRLAFIDILPDTRPACLARDHQRMRLEAVGVVFLPVRSLLDARFALEDCGILDPRAA